MLNAQTLNFRWAKQMGGASDETGNGVAADASGNVYTVGNFKGTVDFDPGPGIFTLTATSTEDAFISKFDGDGNFLWAMQLSGSDHVRGSSIALDNSNNIYITGSFSGLVDFDPGLGSYTLGSIGGQDIFIAKFNADGILAWVKQFGEQSTFAAGNALTADASGNVLVTGRIADIYICIIKCDPLGNTRWEKRIGQSTALCISTSIITDPSGNVYTTGYFSTNSTTNPVDFDPGPGVYNLSPDGNADVFVSKLDPDGNFVWGKQIGGVNLEQAYGIAIDISGYIIVTGYFNGICDFDPSPAAYNIVALGDEDIFITKLDIAGNFVWAKQVAGALSEFSNAIVTDAAGNIYLTGYFYGTTDFDPGSGVYSIPNKGSSDIFVSKLDGDGNFRWAVSMGGAGTDWSSSLFLDTSGNIYTTGYFDNLADFDIGPGQYILNTLGNKDVFVHKMSYCTDVTYTNLSATACKEYVLNGHTYSVSGTYTQYLLNINGCDSILRLNLTITESVTTVEKIICQGQSYYAGGANQTASGIYYDTYITSLGCDSVVRTNLTVSPKPRPNLGPDGQLCANNNSATINPGSFKTYLWQDNSTQPEFIVNTPGKYWVTVTDMNNCSATDTLTVIRIDTIPRNFLPDSQVLCYGNIIPISVPGYASYLWNNGSTNSTYEITRFGDYYLTATDFNNCTGTDTISISRKNCIYMNIPNAFTPDGNALNDVFRPTINQAIKSFSFMVFNRHGQKIFETADYTRGWDGTWKGKVQPAASYVYRIRYTNIFGVETVENGSFLLIR